jgi:transposase
VKPVADHLGYGVESMRSWVRQAHIDDGARPGTTTANAARIKALEHEEPGVASRERDLEVSAPFFAAKLARPQK